MAVEMTVRLGFGWARTAFGATNAAATPPPACMLGHADVKECATLRQSAANVSSKYQV